MATKTYNYNYEKAKQPQKKQQKQQYGRKQGYTQQYPNKGQKTY